MPPTHRAVLVAPDRLLVIAGDFEPFLTDCLRFVQTVGGDEVENGMGFRPTPFMVMKNLVNLKVWPMESVVKVDDTTTGVGEGLTCGCW